MRRRRMRRPRRGGTWSDRCGMDNGGDCRTIPYDKGRIGTGWTTTGSDSTEAWPKALEAENMTNAQIRGLVAIVLGVAFIVTGIIYKSVIVFLMIPGIMLTIAGMIKTFFLGGEPEEPKAPETDEKEDEPTPKES